MSFIVFKGFLFNAIILPLFISMAGIFGAAIGTAISYLFFSYLLIIHSKRILGADLFTLKSFKFAVFANTGLVE